jgi:hypothetical protein
VHLMGTHLMGVHLMGVHLTGVYLTGVHGRERGICFSKFEFWSFVTWAHIVLRGKISVFFCCSQDPELLLGS